jgi:predicted MPP superfamily phosphohydrolase
MSKWLVALALAVSGFAGVAAQDITLPNKPDSLRFAIIGDSGTGSDSQYKVSEVLTASRAKFPYELVLMLGDNLYYGSGEKDYQKKFERPYKALLDSGLKFYATLGNHDNSNERFYKPFNMNGERYYSFKPKPGVRIFSLDSNYMDKPQLAWLEKELAASGADWKIAFFHHPLYSSGGAHGSDVQLREQLEPLFLKYGVDAVFSGHEHFYERIKPQKGIYYFISGGAAKLRDGDVKTSNLTAKAFDSGYHFMLIELAKDTLNFQVISEQGRTVDSGALPRFSDADKKKLSMLTSPQG